MVHIATAAVAVCRGMRKEEERRGENEKKWTIYTTATVFTK